MAIGDEATRIEEEESPGPPTSNPFLVDTEGRPVGVVSMRNIIGYLSTLFPKDALNLPPDPTNIFRQREGA